jgi:hypothetical protein
VARQGFRRRRRSPWRKDAAILIGSILLITAGALWWGSCPSWWDFQFLKMRTDSKVHLCTLPSMIIDAIQEVKLIFG